MLKAERGKLLVDSFVTHCGDDLELIMTHTRGVDSEAIHRLAWNVFLECTGVAKNLKLYGAGQDMPADAFAGNVRGMGPGVAEMEFEERESDPVLVFMAGKTGPGAWNFFLYKIFADPFNTPGLVTDPSLSEGFVFEVHDLVGKRKISFCLPGGELQPACLYRGAVPVRDQACVQKGRDDRCLDKHSASRYNEPAGAWERMIRS